MLRYISYIISLLTIVCALSHVTMLHAKDILETPPQQFLEQDTTARYVRTCDAEGAGFFHIPGTTTCIKIGGNIRAEYRTQTIGKFYIFRNWDPTAINPKIVERHMRDNHGYLGRGRINLDIRTPTPYGTLRAYVDYHLEHSTGLYRAMGQGDETHTHHHLRAAFIQYRGLTAGHTQSMFDFYANYYGYQSIRGSDQVVNLLAYTALFGGGFAGTISFESNTSRRSNVYGSHQNYHYDTVGTSLIRHRPSRYPDIVGAIRVDQGWGSAQFSAGLHSQNIYAGDQPIDSIGYALQLGLRVPILPFSSSKSNDLWVQAAYAHGALGYQHIGSGFSSYNRWIGLGEGEAIGYMNPAGQWQISKPDSWSGLLAYKHHWTPVLATILRGSHVAVIYPQEVAAMVRTNQWHETRLAVTQEWYPLAGLKLGIEALYVRLHQQPPIVNGASFIGVKDLAFKKLTEGIEARIRIERSF